MKFKDLPDHHAILTVTKDRAVLTKNLWHDLQSLSIAHRLFDQTVLDIETARSIISWAKTPYDSERIALISFHTSGIPAQNALLKILEEPPIMTRFIIITSNKEALIPTVLSRLHHITHEETAKLADEVALFLATQPVKRITLPHVDELLERKDEMDRKDREAIRDYILSLAEILTKKKAGPHYVAETLSIASYASDPSASGKSLLEYLALLLPQMK